MGTLFRSQEMSLVQLYIPAEAAHASVAELGELGLVQFRDLNPDVNAFQRSFVNEIRRCDEMERKLRFLATQCEKIGINYTATRGPSYSSSTYRIRSLQEMDELDEHLKEYEARIVQMNSSQETLNRRYLELTELRHVLRETARFFEEAETRTEDLARGNRGEDDTEALLDENGASGSSVGGNDFNTTVKLGFVAGVINRDRIAHFERILWRALRGNLFMNSAAIDDVITDPVSGEQIYKNVFIVFAHGAELLNKIRKICEALGATVYPIDDSPAKRREASVEVLSRLEELNTVLGNTNTARRTELLRLAENLDEWITIVKKEKATYHTMNLFQPDGTKRCLIAEGWVPASDIATIQRALREATERSQSSVQSVLNVLPTKLQHPTFHRTNNFTKGFQAIIDAYGIAKYREVNPGPFAMITFPFLFAVMFGDFGHAILMTLFAAWMVIREKQLAGPGMGEMFQTIFGGRYIILLMGLFSIYTGLIYNDVFSRAFEILPSMWHYDVKFDSTSNETIIAGERLCYENTDVIYTYPFGLDPAWRGTENNLLFTNSYKMKMSVIFGVFQMSFGIVLSLFNHLHTKSKISVIGEFIPQLLFMLCIFGYLVFTIVFKWGINWFQVGRFPGLLNMLIFMFLSPGNVPASEKLYEGQAEVQKALLAIALICVPWMLLSKPFYLRWEHKKREALGYGTVGSQARRASVSSDNAGESSAALTGGDDGHNGQQHQQRGGAQAHDDGGDDEHGPFEFGEVMVHQAIHTIEFCLGCISNTASYLRLWALSLAHSQLSDVLWKMVLENVWGLSFIGIVIGFGFWFALTIFILLIMEGLSAFLHALRLHWVEFNGKFYAATGVRFTPFSFHAILNDEGEED